MTLHTLQQDKALATLVSITDMGGLASLTITLTTTGGVVTGKLIPSIEWAKLSLEMVKGKAVDEDDGMVAFYDIYLAKLTREAAEARAANDALSAADVADDFHEAIAAVTAPAFIHLQDARVLGPNGFIPNGPSAPWRGRLAEVVGWAIGELR